MHFFVSKSTIKLSLPKLWLMRIVYLFLVFLLVEGCNINQKITKSEKPKILKFNCPDNGDCVFEVLRNSELLIKYDDFGKLYPEIVSGDKLVIKYQYKRDPVENAVDGNYSEFVYLEFDEKDKQIILKNEELQKVKMLFGRICFCREAMGYFKVTEGSLFLFINKNKIVLNTTFKVKKVPQIITEINEDINY